jgi:hypothetical protein
VLLAVPVWSLLRSSISQCIPIAAAGLAVLRATEGAEAPPGVMDKKVLDEHVSSARYVQVREGVHSGSAGRSRSGYSYSVRRGRSRLQHNRTRSRDDAVDEVAHERDGEYQHMRGSTVHTRRLYVADRSQR